MNLLISIALVLVASVLKEAWSEPLYFAFSVEESVQHERSAFTEGLVFDVGSDSLVESTGRTGHSIVTSYEIKTQESHAHFEDPQSEFGEVCIWLGNEWF